MDYTDNMDQAQLYRQYGSGTIIQTIWIRHNYTDNMDQAQVIKLQVFTYKSLKRQYITKT